MHMRLLMGIVDPEQGLPSEGNLEMHCIFYALQL